MKAYSQFLKELPSKKVVFAFGRFQPPTIGHELLVKAVERLAGSNGASHVIYASRSQDPKSNPLPVDRKVYYLKRMFPSATFAAAGPTTRTFIEAAKELNKKYNELIMVAGSDRIGEYKRILEKYNGTEFNFKSIQVISAGERDPDSDTASGMSGTKMREAAKKGDFEMFKKGLPSTLTKVDSRRLMNEIRQGMGLEAVKEQVKVVTDWLRESYHRGELFKVGQIVESGGQVYEILSRGSNYLTLVDSNGNTHRKWLRDVTLREDYTEPENDYDEDEDDTQLTYKGYQTQNFDAHQSVLAAFQRLVSLPDADPVAVLNAIKYTDIYLGVLKDAEAYDKLDPEQEKIFGDNMNKAQDYLVKLGDIQHHQDYIMHAVHSIQEVAAKYHTSTFEDAFGESMVKFKDLLEMNFSPSDKVKVARIIADALGVMDVERSSSPTQLLNSALRKVRNKPMRPEYIAILKNMLQTAREAGIDYDENLVPKQVDESRKHDDDEEGSRKVRQKEDEVQTSDYKLDKHGRKIHAHRIRFKSGDEDEVKEEVTPYHKKKSWIKRMSQLAKQERLAREKKEKEKSSQVKEDVSESAIHKPEAGMYGMGQGVLKYADLKRLLGIQEPFSAGGERSNDDLKDNESDQGAEAEYRNDQTSQYPTSAATRSAGDMEHLRRQKAKYHLGEEKESDESEETEEEMEDSDFDEDLDKMSEVDHIIDAYDDHELAIVDSETGEELDDVEEEEDEKEEKAVVKENAVVILEISRMERIRRKQKFASTKSKREVRAQLALKRTSNSATINKRSRRLAISMIKKRMLRKDPSSATIQEKERVEKFLQTRKAMIDRLARRVAPRIRQIEKARLTHKAYTK